MRKLFKTKKRKFEEECWNLNYELVKWLNLHLKFYMEKANKIVDLEWYKFKYKNKEYTQLELIDKLIKITDELLEIKDSKVPATRESVKRLFKLKDEMYNILKIIHFYMGW